jgi:hypothetical protein
MPAAADGSRTDDAARRLRVDRGIGRADVRNKILCSCLGALVDNAAGFALAALNEARITHRDLGGGANVGLDQARQLRCGEVTRGAFDAGQGFDQDLHLIETMLARQHDLIVTGQPGDPQDLFLDLGREHVDATHDHHVVGAAGDLFHAAHGAGGAGRGSG